MSSLKFAVLCVLTAYLLVVAFNFITKLRDARLMQKLLCMLFPISQICLIAFPLACSARYGLSAAVCVALIVLGIACGPVDLLLFRALDQACRWFDSSSKVNMLQEQLRVQNALRQRSPARARPGQRAARSASRTARAGACRLAGGASRQGG